MVSGGVVSGGVVSGGVVSGGVVSVVTVEAGGVVSVVSVEEGGVVSGGVVSVVTVEGGGVVSGVVVSGGVVSSAVVVAGGVVSGGASHVAAPAVDVSPVGHSKQLAFVSGLEYFPASHSKHCAGPYSATEGSDTSFGRGGAYLPDEHCQHPVLRLLHGHHLLESLTSSLCLPDGHS